MVKQKFNEIQNWINDNTQVIEFITKSSIRLYDPDFGEFNHTIEWYHTILNKNKFEKSLLFGEIIYSIEDIKNYVVSNLTTYYNTINDDKNDKFYEEEHNGFYDGDGHYIKEGVSEVIAFFNELNEYSIKSIYEGCVEGDYKLDIQGGRSYLMSDIPLSEMLFNYVYYTNNLKIEELENNLVNNNEVFDNIEGYYNFNTKFYLPNKEELNDIYQRLFDKKYDNLVISYNYLIDKFIKDFKDESILKEKIDIAKSLKIDKDWIKLKLREEKITNLL